MGSVPTIGRGWATIDVDRAIAELGDLVTADAAFENAPRSAALGARCLRAAAADPDELGAGWIVLLEPDTEGRIAAFLARHGEGWAVEWLARDDIAADGGGTPGPLGPERLAPGRSPSGPFRLTITAATIDR